MDENIALSSEINSLNNNNNEDDEISAMIDEINFNEILLSTNINENNFIKEILPSIKDQYSVPSINKVMKIYISNFCKNLIPKKCNYSLVTIPPNVWNGFKGLDKDESIIANCLTIPHNEKEMVRKDPLDISFNYKW